MPVKQLSDLDPRPRQASRLLECPNVTQVYLATEQRGA